MILVTVGTIFQSFTRLINSVIEVVYQLDIREKIIIQAGRYSLNQKRAIPKNILIVDILEFEKLKNLIKKADIIVCSGGEGTLIQILTAAKNKPIIFPRLKQHKEHIDNQQLLIAQSLSKKKLAYLANNKQELVALLSKKYKLETNQFRPINHANREMLIKNLNNLTK